MNLNQRCRQLIQEAESYSDELGIQFHKIGGATIVDFGIDAPGGLHAGVLLAEICMAGLAEVSINQNPRHASLPLVQVRSDDPVLACIGAQYAGWELKTDHYFAMVSGPARCLRTELEEIIVAAGIEETAECAVGILESREFPDESTVQHIAESCKVKTDELYLCIAPTASFAGAIQIVARNIETTLHKLHEVGFPIQKVVSGLGSAPLPLFGKDDFKALGWTNDCILYGAEVQLWIDDSTDEILRIGEKIPSRSSPDFGQPFLELFQKYDCDFYKMDKMLFSPARVTFNSLLDGTSHSFGKARYDILESSMGIENASAN